MAGNITPEEFGGTGPPPLIGAGTSEIFSGANHALQMVCTLEENGMSQIWRNARIAGIYEGANGIHMQSLAARGLRPGGGADEFLALIKDLGGVSASDIPTRGALREKITQRTDPGHFSHPFTELSGTLLNRAIWNRIDAAANSHGPSKDLKRLAARALSEDGFACGVT